MKTIYTTIVIIIIIIIIGVLYWKFKPNNIVNSDSNTDNTSTSTTDMNNNMTTNTAFNLTSTAFQDGEIIPSQYTCDGGNMSPPLTFNNIPAGTKSLALTLYDPDVPKQVVLQGFFDHWVVFNIPATTTALEASSTIGTQGNNGSGKLGYTGPCPPTQYEPKEHRYIFTLYALDSILSLSKGSTRAQLEKIATSTKVLGTAILIGRYQRK